MAEAVAAPHEEVHSAQAAVNDFVRKYYSNLENSRGTIYKFYQNRDGQMPEVSTMQGIKRMIIYLDRNDLKVEIKKIQSIPSYQNGILVNVIGSVNGTGNFLHTLFLVPLEKENNNGSGSTDAYFIFNDMFMSLDESRLRVTEEEKENVDSVAKPEANSNIKERDIHNNTNGRPLYATVVSRQLTQATTADQEIAQLRTPPRSEEEREKLNNAGKPEANSDIKEMEVHNNTSGRALYATVVARHQTQAATTDKQIPVLRTPPRFLRTDVPRAVTPPHFLRTDVPCAPIRALNYQTSSSSAPTRSLMDESDSKCSICVKNLPMNITVPDIRREFNKFGGIEPNGVELMLSKGSLVPYAFVHFETASSARHAIEASPVYIDGNPTLVEEKTTPRFKADDFVGDFILTRGGLVRDGYFVAPSS